jgi:uncharacterized integral membrane protein
MTPTEKSGGLKRNLRLVSIALAVVVVLILVVQNTAEVETRILFATVTMPRAVLLVVMLAVGYVLGLLTAVRGRSLGPARKGAA